LDFGNESKIYKFKKNKKNEVLGIVWYNICGDENENNRKKKILE